jgi:two-component system chemotaxis response regulator CheY
VLVVSSLETESLRQSALASGAVGFVVKPFHPLEITDAVRKALEQVHG